jgi:transcriptional regulator with PAS, ATPase and Fis domain
MFDPSTLVLVADADRDLKVYLRKLLNTHDIRLEETDSRPGLWRVFLPDSTAVVYACHPAAARQCLQNVSSPRLTQPSVDDKRLLGEGSVMKRIKVLLSRAAASDSTVLITGQTGTGKELAADLIHSQSSRRDKPFVCLNCAALPDSLFESELFGYERGAFTGATQFFEGKLSLADQGTLFLDEIGDLSALAQAKILRVIEGKSFQRLGGRQTIRPNVRFVTATNKDLESMVAQGQFRGDLFYRLNVTRIHMPPLSERLEDLPLLVRDLIAQFNVKYRKTVRALPEDVMRLFMKYEWPGNVRELVNVMESAFASCLQDDQIHFTDLPALLREKVATTAAISATTEREQLVSALLVTNWNLSKAAKQLSWSRMTIYRKMAKYRISRGPGDSTPDSMSHHGG